MADMYKGIPISGNRYALRVPQRLVHLIPEKLDEYHDGQEIARIVTSGGTTVIAVCVKGLDHGTEYTSIDFIHLEWFLD